MTARVLVADDAVLFREGLASLLTEHGFEVVASTDRVEHLPKLIDQHRPDLAILDRRMPPTQTTEGLEAGLALRRHNPGIAILILSQYIETRYATELLADDPSGVGYLLKQRVSDVDALLAAPDRLLVPTRPRTIQASSRYGPPREWLPSSPAGPCTNTVPP